MFENPKYDRLFSIFYEGCKQKKQDSGLNQKRTREIQSVFHFKILKKKFLFLLFTRARFCGDAVFILL